jgi:hypothetical protein
MALCMQVIERTIDRDDLFPQVLEWFKEMAEQLESATAHWYDRP